MSITLCIDWQLYYDSFPLFAVLYGVTFRIYVYLKASLEMSFATGLWIWNQEQEFTISLCQREPLMVTV